jgi:hypothetical protein
MSVVIHKDESRTLIIGTYEKYDINQSPDKEIQLYIGPQRPKRLSYEPKIVLSIPPRTKTLEGGTTAGTPEISIWPIPLKVLEDIQERTNGDVRVEDIAEYSEKKEHGKEFFIRIKGYILMTSEE